MEDRKLKKGKEGTASQLFIYFLMKTYSSL